MNALALLWSAHLLGDWVVQTDWQATNKTSSWRAMGAHLLGYHLLLAVALILAVPAWWYALVVGVVSFATHGLLDRRWPVIWLMQHTGSAPFARTGWGVLAVDQALHLSILGLLAAPIR